MGVKVPEKAPLEAVAVRVKLVFVAGMRLTVLPKICKA